MQKKISHIRRNMADPYGLESDMEGKDGREQKKEVGILFGILFLITNTIITTVLEILKYITQV